MHPACTKLLFKKNRRQMPDYNSDLPFELLKHAVEGINRTMELKSLLNRSMESAKTLLHSEASSLMLKDKVSGELSVSIPTGQVAHQIKGTSIPPGKGISGWVAENKKSFLSNKPVETDAFWQELSEDFKTRNIICTPLINSEGEVLGVLQVLNKHDGRNYDSNDRQLLELFASFVASAIEQVHEVDDLKNKVMNREARLEKVHRDLRENLITINSYLQLEAEGFGDARARNILRAASSRVLAIANAHYLLRDQDRLGQIELRSFLNEIFASVSAIFDEDGAGISVQIDSGDIFMEAEKALTLGLLINEVLVLLFRFAFEKQDEGVIHISMSEAADRLNLELKDNGDGLQIDLAEQNSNIDLTAVLLSLSEALGAEIYVSENDLKGTTFHLSCAIE